MNDDSKKTGYGYKKYHSMVKTQVEIKKKIFKRVVYRRNYSGCEDT